MKKFILLLGLALGISYLAAPVRAEDSYAQSQFNQNLYISRVQQKIERNWITPKNTGNLSTALSFTVYKDGEAKNVEIMRPSGDDVFDKSAIDAVFKALPFEVLPDIQAPLTIEIYMSNVFVTASSVLKRDNDGLLNVSDRNSFINFYDYTDNIQSKLIANWNPKTSASQKSAIAIVNIGKDGSLNDYYIQKTSKEKSFDTEILDTIARSVPYDAFPSNISAKNTDIQLTFNYKYACDLQGKYNKIKNVSAHVLNIKGYDNYMKQVVKIIDNSLSDKRFFKYKSMVIETRISNDGRLKYVKVINPSGDKKFDRIVVSALRRAAFPPIPDTINSNEISLQFEVVTKPAMNLYDYVFDYALYGFRRKLDAFNIAKEQ